jgi:(p)ppGpp synthase/HD superfamily hydrolase
MEDVIKAADFAAVKHKDQRRKNKSAIPYINHPIGVARILTSEGKVTDPIVLQAALLHDTVEDTDTTIEEIGDVFGQKVKNIVAEVTDDKSLAKEDRKQIQIDTAYKKSPEAKLVKLADKLHNLRSLDDVEGVPVGWDEKRVHEYFIWAFNVVKGLRGSNSRIELELDELFKKHGVSG